MKNFQVVKEIPGVYRIYPLVPLRRTEGVYFDNVPMEALPRVDAIDRVLHQSGALSPGSLQGCERPWYMHPDQDDNLLVLKGTRYVDVYTPAHGQIESFVISPEKVFHNGELVYDGPAMLVWPRGVFHRIRSADEGSASVNFAIHYEGFNLDTNFNVYDLNTETGTYTVLRIGKADQF
ncbi:MAG: hypothetical protein EOL88_10700 [Bacteroidia bacterium]|nr:hypothetical protein [Bacteroidia bacterium]